MLHFTIFKKIHKSTYQIKLPVAVELPDLGLNQWLSGKWEGMANPGSWGARSASEWLGEVEPGSTPPHCLLVGKGVAFFQMEAVLLLYCHWLSEGVS